MCSTRDVRAETGHITRPFFYQNTQILAVSVLYNAGLLNQLQDAAIFGVSAV